MGLILAVAAIGGASFFATKTKVSPIESAVDNCQGFKSLERVLRYEAEKAGELETEDESPSENQPRETNEAEDGLSAIYEGVLRLEDDSSTIIINTKGQDVDILGLGSSVAECVLIELEAPERVKESVKSTRSIDGRVQDSWGNYGAQWTYHPDNGLNMIISKTEGN